MVADEKEAEIKAVTDTVSSSAGRTRLLGTLLRDPYKPFIAGKNLKIINILMKLNYRGLLKLLVYMAGQLTPYKTEYVAAYKSSH